MTIDLDNGNGVSLELRDNGDIYINGKLAENNRAVVTGMTEFLLVSGFALTDSNLIRVFDQFDTAQRNQMIAVLVQKYWGGLLPENAPSAATINEYLIGGPDVR